MLFLICPSSQPRPEDRDTRSEMKDIPRISPKTGVKFTEALFPGVVYLAKLEKNTEMLPSLALVNVESELLVKIIYSGLAKERYGQDVHMCLAENDMAPRYFTSFATTLPVSASPPGLVSLETYHVMEYLPPPSGASMGWMTLHDLGRDFPQAAQQSKFQITEALEKILAVLRDRKFVHGDLRTNNVLIYVQINENSDGGRSLVIQPSPHSHVLPYLKVVDFDWAGVANKVRYPSIRNPAIHWPGNNGKTIDIDQDKKMISHWLDFWPGEQPVQVPEDVGYVDNVLQESVDMSE
jgi:hypothetical protein